MAKKTYTGIGVGSSTPQSTPVSQPIQGKEDRMALNSAGGYTFTIDAFARLNRFLILGTEGGTYYASEKSLTIKNYTSLLEALKADYRKAIDLIVHVSKNGLAARQEPTLFSLAVAASVETKKGPKIGLSVFQAEECRKYALSKVNDVCRTGTHLFMFVNYLSERRSWGRAVRNAISNWYGSKNIESLAFQLAKYQSREGWSHRDVIRQAHILPEDVSSNGPINNLIRWATDNEFSRNGLIGLVACAEDMKEVTSVNDVIRLIQQYRAPWELVPTQYRTNPEVWKAMLDMNSLRPEAILRNLGNMTSYGVFKSTEHRGKVISILSDKEQVIRARLHPIKSLAALFTYQTGRGKLGSNSWQVDRHIYDAIEHCYYNGFQAVKPTNAKIMLALDISPSMTWGSMCGIEGFNPAAGTATMALAIMTAEKNAWVMGYSSHLIPLKVVPGMRLDAAMRAVQGSYGGTDCSLPYKYALEKGIPVDAFVNMTDNETWRGGHPDQLLNNYRQKTGINAKSITISMTATSSSINDPKDPGNLDLVGFSTDTPQLISAFISGSGVDSDDEEE